VLRSKHLVGLILAATLMATLVPSLTSVYAEGQDKQQEKAEAFVAAAVDAMNEVDELMKTTEVPTDVENRFKDGVDKLTAAQEELGKEEPDYGSAISLAKEAMSIFREVYKQLDSDAKVQSGMEDQSEGLIEAMSRALIRIDRINGTVYGSEFWSEINKILLAAQDYLDVEEAQNWLDEGRVNETAWNLTQANKLMGLAHSLLKKGGQELKVKRIEQYLDILEKFCDRLQQLAEKAGPEAEDLLDQLNYVNQTYIVVAKAALDEEPPDIQQAMENLIEARNQLEQIKRDLLELRRGKPPAPSETWRVLADLEDESSFNDVEAYITKTDKAKSVEFKVEIVSENVPHGVYGMGIAVSKSIDTIDFQVWYREYATPYGWYYQEYPWDTSPVVALGDSGTGITATGDHTGKVFTVDIPIELLGKRGATYYFAIQFRTNYLGTYPEDLDLWAQTDASEFAEATV